jgi:hypothetical protein
MKEEWSEAEHRRVAKAIKLSPVRLQFRPILVLLLGKGRNKNRYDLAMLPLHCHK